MGTTFASPIVDLGLSPGTQVEIETKFLCHDVKEHRYEELTPFLPPVVRTERCHLRRFERDGVVLREAIYTWAVGEKSSLYLIFRCLILSSHQLVPWSAWTAREINVAIELH